MHGGILVIIVAFLVCPVTASAWVILPDDLSGATLEAVAGLVPDDGSVVLTGSQGGCDAECRKWDELIVYAGNTAWEEVYRTYDPTMRLLLTLSDEVISGQGQFWIEYTDGTCTYETPVQPVVLGCLDFEVECLGCRVVPRYTCTIPAQKKDLVIRPLELCIVTTPEPSTLWLLAVTVGGIFLRRRG